MKQHEIYKIQQLDVQGHNGTIASVLLDPNINQAHYAEVLYYLLAKTLDERSYYERINLKMMNTLKTAGLLTNELLELEDKEE